MKYLFFLLLPAISLFSQERISLGINLKSLSYGGFHNLKNTIYYFYQVAAPSLSFSYYRDQKPAQELEFRYYFPESFIGLGYAFHIFPEVSSRKILDDFGYALQWKGNYSLFFFQYGKEYPLRKKHRYEISGGIGWIPEFSLRNTVIFFQDSPVKPPAETFRYSFRSREGLELFLQTGYAFLLSRTSLRLGIRYSYGISSNFTSGNGTYRWFWIDNRFLWITRDIHYYFLAREEYLSKFHYVIFNFPVLTPAHMHWHTLSFQLGIHSVFF